MEPNVARFRLVTLLRYAGIVLAIMLLAGLPAAASGRPAGSLPGDNLSIGPQAWNQVAKVTASDGVDYDYFGVVALRFDTLVVGAHGQDSGRGAAYVYYRNQGGNEAWGQVKKVIAIDGAASDDFGSALALDGDTLAVGAGNKDSETGAAYVHYRNQGGNDNWGHVKKVTASDAAANCDFGDAVALQGDTLVVGAPGCSSNVGVAYVFYRNQGGSDNWGQAKKLTISGGAPGDHFGNAVAIHGDTIVVGAEDRNGLIGAAYIFYRNQGGSDNWGQVKEITVSGGAIGDFFGNTVAVFADVVVVGEIGNNSDQGAAYVYYRNQGGNDNWGLVVKIVAADGASGDYFGGALSLNFDMLAVGAPGDDDYYGGSGSVYLFNRSQGGPDSWGQVQKLNASDAAAGDGLGGTVAVDGGTLSGGAILDDTCRGSAYVFKTDAPPPSPQHTVFLPMVYK